MFNTLIFLAFLGREQPPPRGCVLKLGAPHCGHCQGQQPPPRGCVLKLFHTVKIYITVRAAASARLCVETYRFLLLVPVLMAAASARLCVETSGL